MVDFIVTSRLLGLEQKRAGQDRRAEAVSTVARAHGISERTLERLYADPLLRNMATPIAESIITSGDPVALNIEYFPQDD